MSHLRLERLRAEVTAKLKSEITRMVRRSILATLGLICLVIGMGFFTSAIWIALARAEGPLVAALALGAGYAGLGVIWLGALAMTDKAQAKARPAPPDPAPARGGPPDLATTLTSAAAAFATGLGAGLAARPAPGTARRGPPRPRAADPARHEGSGS